MTERTQAQSTVVDEEVDALVRTAARVTDADVARMDLAAGFNELLDNVLQADGGATPRGVTACKHRHPKKVIVTSVVAGGVLAASAGLAAAGKITVYDVCRRLGGACTGDYLPAGSAPADRSQRLDIWESNYPAVVKRIARIQNAPWSPGSSEAQYIKLLIRNERRTDRSDGTATDYSSITGVAASIANAASCSWERAWLRGYVDQNQSEMDQSAKIIRQAAGWKIIKLVDAASFQMQIADAAERGDAETVRRLTAMNCGNR